MLTADQRFRAYDGGRRNVLLLFQRGSTLETVRMPGGTIPPHDGHGPLHIAFAVAADELAAWETRLGERGIAIEGRTDWSRGGHSIYFRDPDGHLLELATPGCGRSISRVAGPMLWNPKIAEFCGQGPASGIIRMKISCYTKVLCIVSVFTAGISSLS